MGEPGVILFYWIFSVSVSIGGAWSNNSELAPAENICIVHVRKMPEPELTLIKLYFVLAITCECRRCVQSRRHHGKGQVYEYRVMYSSTFNFIKQNCTFCVPRNVSQEMLQSKSVIQSDCSMLFSFSTLSGYKLSATNIYFLFFSESCQLTNLNLYLKIKGRRNQLQMLGLTKLNCTVSFDWT